jgi:hypothetical protein
MSHKLGICIPYRDRKEHIDNLIPALTKHLNEKGIEHTFYVGHQVDEKLFNRGAMKNIAAHIAFEDGCDYIAWHDVDMIPHPEADYSYPEEHPTHIATKLSKYSYGLGYDQYFGGVVLFTKEQVEKTNGYSNDYWDWGQEDDDLFWRCYFENMTTGNSYKTYENKSVANFDGINSKIAVDCNREISAALSNNHTISVLFYAEQQPEKVPIWLVGDEEKQFIEYPLLRKDGAWTWGLSFNNSRSVNMGVFDKDNNFYYNWAKKFEKVWTWVTISYNKSAKKMYMYVNNELVTNQKDIKENKPTLIPTALKPMSPLRPLLIGFCSHTGNLFKGKIAQVKIFDEYFKNIDDVFTNETNLILNVDFENGIFENKNDLECGSIDVEITKEDINVIDNVLPFRRESKFDCMFHTDEGYVNGKWAKGETTARNEKRFVTEMQQGLINYKKDGINNILNVLKIEKIDVSLYDNTKFINVKMI